VHGGDADCRTPLAIATLRGVVQVARAGDPAVAEVAAAQRGAISYRQLTAAGLGRGAIAHRVAQGRLHRVHRGVFLVGHRAAAPLARETAALLACGDGAVLSHRTAAAMWGLIDALPANVDVTVHGRDCGRRAGVRNHRLRHPAKVVQRDGLPITAPPRTLLDLAEAVTERDLERALNEAFVQQLTTESQLRDTAARANNRRGARLLREALDRATGPTLTRSEAERLLLDLLQAGRLPAPETNVKFAGYEVDALWRDRRLVVEIDGYAFHRTRDAFERDRRRDADLQAAGFRVLRTTWRQLTEQPQPLLVRIAQLLATD
jgi:very-short-patch-repair endonuclease